MRVRSDFNPAIFTIACGLLIAVTTDEAAAAAADGSLRDDPFCSASLSVVLENSGGNIDGVTSSRPLENGDIVYDGVIYPANLRWTDGNLTYGCICRLRKCIKKCCGSDEIIRQDLTKRPICVKIPRGETDLDVPKMPKLRLAKEQLAEEIQHIEKLTDYFYLKQDIGCCDRILSLNADDYEDDRVVLQTDGSLLRTDGMFYPMWSHCLDWQMTIDKSVPTIGILVCFTPKIENDTLPEEEKQTAHHVGMIVSIPFLFVTFLVYAITPELRNLYGKTLMCYVLSLITAYLSLILINYYLNQSGTETETPSCIVTAFIIYFSFLASFFWLNVMCFDIWWTFGGFRSLQGSVRQREKKKFIMYSIYAWGSASIFTIVCAIMNFIPNVPKEYIRPEFGVIGCWFTTEKAKAVYFYGPMSVTVLCNIYLFISTAMKIVRHNRDTAHQLRGSESRRHDENKQRFNLYLKLFIVMGINWSMEIISWLVKSAPKSVWYLTDLTNSLQGLIIFIIFVWKNKIKRLLLKRFGCQDRSMFSGNSTRSGYHSSASRTCTTTMGVIPLQEKVNPPEKANCHTKNSSETDIP